MFKFFRRIRSRLLSENKFSKYLLYAIGEIILVVIGILIALQINNWNEEQKLAKTEHKIIAAILEDIKKTLTDMEGDTHLNELSLDAARHIQSYLNDQASLDDSLILNFEIAAFDYKLYDLQAAYKSLQNKGIDIIRNDSLRDRIVFFYESAVPFLKRSEQPPRLFHNLLFPYYQEHFRVNTDLEIKKIFDHHHLDVKYENTIGGFIPKNEDFVKNDTEFEVLIREVIYSRSQVLALYKKELHILKELVRDLKERTKND